MCSSDLVYHKIVQDLIIELEVQFVLDLQVEEACKTGLEFLPGQLVVQTALIIVTRNKKIT